MYSRVPIQLRVAPVPLSQVDLAAKEYGLTRADVLRACLAVSFQHWVEVCDLLDKKKAEM